MHRKKIRIILLVFILILIPTCVLADDEFLDENLFDLDLLEVIETSGEITDIPNINARHAVVLDRLSKQVLFGKNETEKCKMASTTKIMTAIVVIENTELSDLVTVSSKAAHTGGSRVGLSTNDKITVENLLYGLMLCSGNDAAVALAEYTAGSVPDFAVLMNKKATELGLYSTHFVTPHGLDEDEHYTTAYELALLSNYALQNDVFSKIVKTKYYTININGNSKNISNTNELLGVLEGIYGVKTGFTNGANRCLVTACKRGDLDIICVVLGCDTKKFRTTDSIKLINYVFKNFVVVNIEDFIDNEFKAWNILHYNSFTINKGYSQILTLSLDKSNIPFSHLAINISDIKKQHTVINYSSFYEAPLFSNTVIGNMEYFIDGKPLFSLDIVSCNVIDKKNILYYFKFLVVNFFNILNS